MSGLTINNASRFFFAMLWFLVSILPVKHCLSEGDYDDVASDTSHNEANNDNLNKNDTPFDRYAFALKVLENEAAEIKPKEAWHDGDAENEVNDNDVVEKKNVKKFSIRKWFGRLLEDVSEQMRTAKFIHTHIYIYIHNLYIYRPRSDKHNDVTS